MEIIERKPARAERHGITAPERCAVAIVYFDAASRDRALMVCDSLLSRFRNDLEFEFTWWNARYLADPQVARLASEALAASDLIIFAAGEGIRLTPELKKWISAWTRKRHGREGALAVYVAPTEARVGEQYDYFRGVAARAHLDFLAPPLFSEPRRGSAAAIEQFGRAPLHWGINE